MYRIDFWTLWEKARVGCFKRTASKHVYYLWWNRSPAQVGCMRQLLGPGALGRPRGIRWRGRWEGGSGWGIHVYPWLIHVNVWQKTLQYCKVISLQLIKEKRKKKKRISFHWIKVSHCLVKLNMGIFYDSTKSYAFLKILHTKAYNSDVQDSKLGNYPTVHPQLIGQKKNCVKVT